MKLIVGLGNPGNQYVGTRHNTGFAIVDHIVSEYGEAWQDKSKFKGLLTELTFDSRPVFFLKPQTFYNDSGQSVRAVKDFYKIANKDILVIHDELVLPFGSLRTRVGGSDAGNNGIKSINTYIGEDYARIRVGIYNELRERQDDADFVLSKFSKKESETFQKVIDTTQKILAEFASDIFESTSYNLL
jgi:peptidyl-tRNA hydrolase, PTH1 family